MKDSGQIKIGCVLRERLSLIRNICRDGVCESNNCHNSIKIIVRRVNIRKVTRIFATWQQGASPRFRGTEKLAGIRYRNLKPTGAIAKTG